MGLLVHSKLARPPDITDHVASVSYRVLGSVHRGGVLKIDRGEAIRSSQMVQLIRTRALSAGSPEGSCWWYCDEGENMSLLVTRDGLGNAHLYLTRLLQDTQPPSRWQRPLRDLLSVYILPNDAKQALSFLMRTMNTAIAAVQDHSTCPRYPSLFINVEHKPVVFPVDAWKHVLLALYFDLTEPEGAHDVDLIEVNVTAHVTVPLLQGFTLILQNLLDLDWGMLRLLLGIQADEGLRLLSALQDVLVQSSHIEDTEILLQLYARYPDQISALGFSYRSKAKPQLTWQRPENDHVLHMEVVLLGLFHDGTGLESFI